jgi:hypothetical protein
MEVVKSLPIPLFPFLKGRLCRNRNSNGEAVGLLFHPTAPLPSQQLVSLYSDKTSGGGRVPVVGKKIDDHLVEN